MGMKIKQWLQSLSFRTVLHTILYPVLRPDAAAYQYNSKGRALGCALRNGKDLPVWRSDHSGR